MALQVKSLDEETNELADIYDELIKPKKLFRNHNNKLYLALRAFAAGKAGLMDAALALHNKFDPRYCEDIDLYSTAKLVGTEFKKGSGSLLYITVTNTSQQQSYVLYAGTYNYQSSSGMIFSFELPTDYSFDPEEEKLVIAVSSEKGKFEVTSSADIALFRTDNDPINKNFSFSCQDNAGQLGYEDETPFDFRTRILNDVDRQDHIKELEIKIRNLPGILECTLVVNEDTVQQEYDSIMLAPKELLIMITGSPTDDIARLVCETVLYDTHQTDPSLVTYYYNDSYINGRRPVYYKFHDTTDFSLSISYEYNSDTLKPALIEAAMLGLFKPYTCMATHLSLFNEHDAYKILQNLDMPGVVILNVDVFNDQNEDVPYIRIPKTRLPHLTGISFSAVVSGGAL